jgi:hypothetical protein
MRGRTHGALGVSQIARETVNLLKVIRIKKRTPDAGATATAPHVTLYCPLECRAKNGGERKDSWKKGVWGMARPSE